MERTEQTGQQKGACAMVTTIIRRLPYVFGLAFSLHGMYYVQFISTSRPHRTDDFTSAYFVLSIMFVLMLLGVRFLKWAYLGFLVAALVFFIRTFVLSIVGRNINLAILEFAVILPFFIYGVSRDLDLVSAKGKLESQGK